MNTKTLEKLYEKFGDELKDIAEKPMSSATLESADKLTHAMKNICKLMDYEEGESDYSMRGDYPDRSYRYDDGGMSMARGRGRNARRDSRGRYSNEGGRGYSRRGGGGGYSMHDDGEMVDRLYDMMDEAKDENERKEIQRMIDRMEK